jgi:hypothetical protein
MTLAHFEAKTWFLDGVKGNSLAERTEVKCNRERHEVVPFVSGKRPKYYDLKKPFCQSS